MHLKKPVCDQHLQDMREGSVRIGHGVLWSVLEGWKCPVPGCNRFYGTHVNTDLDGAYGDLDDKEDFVNVRIDPACSDGHGSCGMYVQHTETGFRWRCPICEATQPFRA